MDRGPWDVVVYGVAVHQGTREVRHVRLGWRGGSTAALVLESGGRCRVWDRAAREVAELVAFLFGGGDGGDLVAVADPVNLDGSRRHGLRDRLARRGALLGLAAGLVLLPAPDVFDLLHWAALALG